MRISKDGKIYGFKKKHRINVGRVATEETKKTLRLAYTEERRKQAREQIRNNDYLIGNTYYKSFLRKLTPENQRIWKKENGRKISISLKANTEYMKVLKKRMMGNTFCIDYLIKHPRNVIPDWSKHTPFESVPEFVAIPKTPLSVIGQINYFCCGAVGGGGLL